MPPASWRCRCGRREPSRQSDGILSRVVAGAIELVRLCGTSVQARERIIESLMAEFGATPDSAIQHLASAKRHVVGQRTGGIHDENCVRRI